MVGLGGGDGSCEGGGEEEFCAEEALVEERVAGAEEVSFRRCWRKERGLGSSAARGSESWVAGQYMYMGGGYFSKPRFKTL